MSAPQLTEVREPDTGGRPIATEPQVPLAARLCVVGALIIGAWTAALWTSTHVHADETLRTVALFAHLSALIVGLGAVLTIDWCALLWLLGRRRLLDVLMMASTGHPIIWLGLAVLTASGALLSPDLGVFRTQLKLGLVLVAALNGVHAYAIQHRLEQHGESPPRALLARSALSAGVSQTCWWGATLIGFLNHQTH